MTAWASREPLDPTETRGRLKELKREIALNRYDVDARAVADAILRKLRLVKRGRMALADQRSWSNPAGARAPSGPLSVTPPVLATSPITVRLEPRSGDRLGGLVRAPAAGSPAARSPRRRRARARAGRARRGRATSATPAWTGSRSSSISSPTLAGLARCPASAPRPSLRSIIAVAPAAGQRRPGGEPRRRARAGGGAAPRRPVVASRLAELGALEQQQPRRRAAELAGDRDQIARAARRARRTSASGSAPRADHGHRDQQRRAPG